MLRDALLRDAMLRSALLSFQAPRSVVTRRMARGLLCCCMVWAAACSKPHPPEKERPPEPQAAHGELRDAIQAPIDKARAVEADVQRAADEQRAAIEASGG